MAKITDMSGAPLQPRPRRFRQQEARRAAKSTDDDEYIPDTELSRIVNDSGVLRLADDVVPSWAIAAQAFFITIPLAILHTFLEWLVYKQFQEDEATLGMIARESTPTAFAVLLVLVYVTHRWSGSWIVQLAMAVGGAVVGGKLVATVTARPALGVMLRTPGMATVWIYFVAQMRLELATLSLAAVGGYYYLGVAK
ncbi:hypothetical protein AMAG_16168 [Allomyces macrogynus ATCC 38327]|uniref:DUF7719 domain-containing protein n=1 Tax=Allomyces macrogynus (strain ATCC 38327) TaxID=578462 RepID=A0A0L0TA56_ALLM3|nr:hypothetical protein AMAG_16168 [Allomyces macrogynus ATCC 38327]|eukprot:KNE71606.1 hypothetical protein AMAG_16168 [Allomyces macrogynus ATCC 38327]